MHQLLLGDLNHCNLDSTLPGFCHYVKKGRRNDKVLDKCYVNVKNAYESRIRPPIVNTEHNIVYLYHKI